MKSEHVKVNTLYFSKRFNCYGMCLAKARYMAYLLFSENNKSAFSGWYHCQEIEKSHKKFDNS